MARGLRRVLGGDRALSEAVARGALVWIDAAVDDDKTVTAVANRNVTDGLRFALAGALLVAAGAHVLVGLQHSSSNFGALAIVSGAVQFGLAVAAMLRPSRQAYRLATVACLVLIELYVLNVTVGLPPLVAHTHSAGTHDLFGLTLAAPAQVDGEGILAKSAELAAILFGGLLYRSG